MSRSSYIRKPRGATLVLYVACADRIDSLAAGSDNPAS